MSIINSQPLIGASGNQSTAYNLTRSLRFRSSASAYLNRTFGSGSTTAWTWSAWVKRGYLGANQSTVFFGDTSNTNYGGLHFTNDNLYFDNRPTSGLNARLITTQVFRDPSAWYHIVAVWNTANATSSDRLQLYVNGVRITAFSTATYPAQNTTSVVNTNIAHELGCTNAGSGGVNNFFDGYLAEVNFIDGQALTPTSFGATNAATGVWQPIAYTGTYGTNGFYLKFTNTTSTSTLGNDSSGNNNTWTVNNISLTSGATYDSMTDVPTNTSATVANYAVMNPLNSVSGGTLSNANLTWQSTAGAVRVSTATTTIISSSKTYFEMTVTTVGGTGGYAQIGIVPFGKDLSAAIGNTSGSGYSIEDNQSSDIRLRLNGSSVTVATAVVTGDTLQVAIDQSTGKLWFGRNNVWYNSTGGTTGNPAAGTNETATVSTTTDWYPAIAKYDTLGSYSVNFGQRPFAYTPPSGYVALNTFNLPTPTIGATASTQANKYFDALIWTGDNSTANATKNRTGLNFQPDFVWIKNRSNAYSHNLYDAVRGAGSSKDLQSDTTNSESGNSANAALYGYVSAFNSDGFQTTNGTDGTSGGIWVNQSSQTYVGWNWKANGSGSTNTSGSITSTVSANTTAGFSIVTWTGTGSGTATVGHGLGVAPNLIITKPRNITADWIVYSSILGSNAYLVLNSTAAQVTGASTVWNNTAPTSTVFSLGSGYNYNATMLAYCFAQVAGYSAFGSYTGNGSTDGAFVFTGFRPKYILIKNTGFISGYGDWYVWDSIRNTYNIAGSTLRPNTSDQEYTNNSAYALDIVSNGFKVRNSYNDFNANGYTYIYAAFAEHPFKYSLAR